MTTEEFNEKLNYVYIYLDPRKPGNYNYIIDDHILYFNHEPFYVGHGKNKRCKDHIKEARNTSKSSHKLNKIRSLLAKKICPIIVLLKINLSAKEAADFETKYIAAIGRYDLKKGPLTNQTNGGEGTICLSKEAIEKQKITYKKTLENSPEIIENQIRKHKETLKNNPEISKQIGKKISDNYKNKPEIITKISESLKKTYEEHPEILEEMAETQRKRYAEDPSIMEKTHKKRLETYKNNPELKIKRNETYYQTLTDHPEILETARKKRKETYKKDPTPWIEAGKKRSKMHKENPDFFKQRSEWYSQDCKKRSELQKECYTIIDQYKIDTSILEFPSNHKKSKVWENFKSTLLEIINENI